MKMEMKMEMKIAENDLHYIYFFVLFAIGQTLVMIGSFISLPYKELSLWASIKMTLPFVWLDWIFLTFAIDLMHKYSLLTPTQFLFLLIIFQFSVTLLVNKFYLKQVINKSDYVAIFLLLGAYFISELNLFSKGLLKDKQGKKYKDKDKENKIDQAKNIEGFFDRKPRERGR
jgi:hypothetical protein